MAKSFQSAPEQPSEPPQEGQRLESWKEIAAYLKRDLRTVQRWERRESLPIHRHVHDKRSSVYVYTSELDAWRNNGRPRLEEPERKEPTGRVSRQQWPLWLAGLVAAALLAIIGVYLWLGRRPAQAEFHQHDWVLIAKFQNRTGEALLDGVLESALDSDLSNSAFLNVVPQERIADDLKLMKRPPGTPIDPALGRELCLRDGGIRAVLTGQIEKAGASYILRADLIDPKDGVLFARASEQATDQNAVLAAALRLSNQLRKQIREPLPSLTQAGQRLEQVTTPSLHALQLYSQGMALVNQYKWEAAAALLEQAVSEDPQFASAHIYLAHCYSNLQKDEQAAPHYQQAFALANTTTDRERYFILGSYYQRFANEPAKAIEAYKILVSLYPDDYWGNNNLAGLLGGKESEAALPYVVRRADLRPTDISNNWTAGMALVSAGRDVPEAEHFASRLQGLLSSPEIVREHGQATVWTELFPGRKAWMRGDPGPLLEECDRLRRTMDFQSGPAHEYFLTALSAAYMALGKFKTAREMLSSDEDPKERYLSLAFDSYAKDDEPDLKQQLINGTPFEASSNASVDPELPIPLLARAGLVSEAQKLLSWLQAPENANWMGPKGSAELMSFQGELALARGEPAKAIPLLQNSLSWKEGCFTFLWGSEDLARAWELEGNLPRAIRALEDASKEKSHEAYVGAGAFLWVHVEGRLAELYRKAGRDQDAQRTETELLHLLADADPDDPILVRLKQSGTLASAQTLR